MLVERGAQRVVSFDKAPKPHLSSDDPRIQWMQGDITSLDDCMKACEGVDCVFHVAAIVGPFHPLPLYRKVNYDGTLNLVEACKRHKVRKFVNCGTPSTRMHGGDLAGVSEADMRMPARGKFLAAYAETKAMAELALNEACCDSFLVVTVAPHQVYGPRDSLFLPNLLNAARTNKLRVFGKGANVNDFCYVDNYCHGLILAERQLVPGGKCLGKFYVVTDGEPQSFWKTLDDASTHMGYQSLYSRAALPAWLLFSIGYVVEWMAAALAGVGLAERHKVLNALKLNSFTVRMLVIHRYFDISAARRDLGYKPLFTFDQGWSKTKEWFKKEWAPKHRTTEEIRVLGWS
uniref:3-beta hydroxysteroid dehydrogenase/isomerase domain-containing protein n=1 Tax=Hemiselmis tepida TaxID=464990 RepID=A0A7S0YTQ1_9CRYP